MTCLGSRDFKSLVSTSFTTRANAGSLTPAVLRRKVEPLLASTRQGWLVARYWQPAVDNQGDKAPTSRIELLDNGPR